MLGARAGGSTGQAGAAGTLPHCCRTECTMPAALPHTTAGQWRRGRKVRDVCGAAQAGLTSRYACSSAPNELVSPHDNRRHPTSASAALAASPSSHSRLTSAAATLCTAGKSPTAAPLLSAWSSRAGLRVASATSSQLSAAARTPGESLAPPAGAEWISFVSGQCAASAHYSRQTSKASRLQLMQCMFAASVWVRDAAPRRQWLRLR